MPPLGWRGDDPWPLVDEAKQALSALASGHAVELRFGGRRQDRHGYYLAHVFVVEGENRFWLQEQLLAKGLARVYSFDDNRACVAELLAREGEARAKRLGLWASYAYRIEPALDVKRLGRLIHSYQLVEGTVVTVGEGGGRLYISISPRTGGATSPSASTARTWAPSLPPASTSRPLPAGACAPAASLPGATAP